MFKLKIDAGEGGEDAKLFASELATVIEKTTGVAPVNGLYRL
jgi:protein subunit release factor A